MRMGYRTIAADGGVGGLNMLKGRKDIALVLLDLVMPDMDGFSVLAAMRELGLTTPTIVQTAQGSLDMAVKAIKLGAVDFVAKPVPLERLQVSVSNALKLDALTSEIRRVRFSARGQLTFGDLMSRSAVMKDVMRLGQKAAGCDVPVLIEGEQGVGKEMLARAIQGSGHRSGRPFVSVNCMSMSAVETDHILFGYEKGAFPGAAVRYPGKIGEAEGGTIFFDDVGRLPQNIQLKLLNAIEAGEISPQGASAPRKSDVRFIASSKRSLVDLVQTGQFHPKLFALFSGFTITLPALRERQEDIGLMAHHFMMRFTCEEGRGHITSIAPHALLQLKNYDWPGNVRQLENATFRAVVLCEKASLSVDDFPQVRAAQPRIMAENGYSQFVARSVGTGFAEAGAARDHRDEDADTGQGYLHDEISARAGAFNGLDAKGEVRSLAEAEEAMIRLAITHYAGQISEVARRLGIGRTTLYRKIKDYDIDVDGMTQKATEL